MLSGKQLHRMRCSVSRRNTHRQFVTTYKVVIVISYIHTLNYTESNCICVVGGYKMHIYWAKHEYIQYCLYILSPTSCNGNTPVTLSPTRLLYSLKLESKGHEIISSREYQRIEKM